MGFSVGDTIKERYEILSLLPSGGMATALVAFDREQGEEIVIKIVNPDQLSDGDLIVKFLREFEILSTLSHPNIVKVYEQGTLLLGELKVQVPYYTMEYVKHTSFPRFIAETEKERKTKAYVIKVINFLIQISSALRYIHSQGIVYSDLTANNVLIEEGGYSIKLIDFGLARYIENQTEADLNLGLGTPGYMSPEQYDKKKINHTSDIYSFGCLAFELLTGSLPFSPEDPSATEFSHKLAAPPSLREINPAVPKFLNRIVVHCLEKEGEERFQSTDKVRVLLEQQNTDLQRPTVLERTKALFGAK